MELKVGQKFRLYYNEKNINNRPYVEVRGVVDGEVVVLLCKTPKGKWYYEMKDLEHVALLIEEGKYIPLKLVFNSGQGYSLDDGDQEGKFEVKWGESEVNEYTKLSDAAAFYESLDEEKVLWDITGAPELLACHVFE